MDYTGTSWNCGRRTTAMVKPSHSLILYHAPTFSSQLRLLPSCSMELIVDVMHTVVDLMKELWQELVS